MPIIIDTNDKDALNPQVESINKTLAVNKTLDPKYFSKNLTGNGKRKDGLFSAGSNTFSEFMQNKRRLLEDVRANLVHGETFEHYRTHTYGNSFNQGSKHKEKEYKKFESSLTTMLPPVIINGIINNRHESVALSFPKDSYMFHLYNIKHNWIKLTSGKIDGKPATTYAKIVVQSMDLYAKESQHKMQSGHVSKKSHVAAQPETYIIFATMQDDMKDDGDVVFINHPIAGNRGKTIDETQAVATISVLKEKSRQEYDYDHLADRLSAHLSDLISNKKVAIPTVTPYDLSLLIGDESITDTISEQAVLMSTHIEDALLSFSEAFAKRITELQKKEHQYPQARLSTMASLVAFVQHIDTLNNIDDNIVTTDMLAKIYNVLNDNLAHKPTLHSAARHSLRLLLSQRLHELDAIKNSDGLYAFEPKNTAVVDAMKKNPNYSMQQKKIVTTTDPLVIGQAGAGSGKSHTLIGRINYMIDQGEDISKALVLSFTNVAAININNRFPGVRSETLANMFHTIYSATHPAQSLSQPSTVANSMRLLNPGSNYFKKLGFDEDTLAAFIYNFAERLEQFDQTGFKRVDVQQELKRLSNLMEGNLDMAIALLDAVEQTTLELEPIIIHHKLLNGGEDLNIPQEYQDLNYIITDESQDISTFEYILLLELTIHYRSQLLIIGDGSQTLYEFRNSDPRYMNALEASGVFTSHKLETNYRSNEEILMFANQFLKVIDANKHANIQLKSSNFSTPTEASVKEAIQVSDNEISGGTANKAYTESLVRFIEDDTHFQNWFIDRVRKGEQVAFMGWTRAEVIAVGEAIEKLLAKHNLSHIEPTNIMSNNERPMTILSRFAHDKSAALRGMDPTHAHYLKEIDRIADDFVKRTFNHASPKQAAFYNGYIYRNVQTVKTSREWQTWVADYNAGRITQQQVGSFLIQALLRLETRKNAMDQYLRKQKDTPNYDECPILLSTIHGTKGLEFDHTVVMFNEAKRAATSQESLRMMFVALSRAKKSEYIINSHKPTKNRSVGTNLSDMLTTPMGSAFLRTLDDAARLNAPNGITPNNEE